MGAEHSKATDDMKATESMAPLKLGSSMRANKVSNEQKEELLKPSDQEVSKASNEQEADMEVMKVHKKREMMMKMMMEKPKKVPHMYEVIMKEADAGSLQEHIHSGVFLNNRRKMYWVDEPTGCNCFMLFARDLKITWSEEQQYWQWQKIKEARETEIEVAKLENVCWLEVHGRFNTSFLNPKTTYDVVFVVMITNPCYGWWKPVNLRLKFANKNGNETNGGGGVAKEQKKTMSLLEFPRERWVEIKVGEIVSNGEEEEKEKEEVEISLFEWEAGHWKRGLMIKGVIIRPKIA